MPIARYLAGRSIGDRSRKSAKAAIECAVSTVFRDAGKRLLSAGHDRADSRKLARQRVQGYDRVATQYANVGYTVMIVSQDSHAFLPRAAADRPSPLCYPCHYRYWRAISILC